MSTKPTEEEFKVIASDLQKYYKRVYICICGRIYGSDHEEGLNSFCPICLENNKKKDNQDEQEVNNGNL